LEAINSLNDRVAVELEGMSRVSEPHRLIQAFCDSRCALGSVEIAATVEVALEIQATL
jgi:hypothetical protein